jgi:hypothetical protein
LIKIFNSFKKIMFITMKKLLLSFGFMAFVAIAGASAQCAKSSASCCAKKSSTTAAAATQEGSDAMVKKVANTSETKSCAKAEG